MHNSDNELFHSFIAGQVTDSFENFFILQIRKSGNKRPSCISRICMDSFERMDKTGAGTNLRSGESMGTAECGSSY